MGECLAVLFSLSALPACEQPETRTLAGELDYVLENKGVFDRKREERIAELRRTLHVTGLSPRQEYEINARLCDEFWKYKLDSAIRYAERNLAIARQLHDTPETYTSGLRLAQLYSFSGKSVEAKRILDTTRRKTLPTPLLPLYYETYNRLFGHYAAISYQKKYDRQAALYGDSLMMVLDPASYAYRSNRAGRLIGQGRLDEAQSLLTELLGEIETNTPHYAEITYAFGSLFQKRHDDRLALKYYRLSAIADIRNATKENASLQALARMSYAAGDLSDAFKYAQAAIDDALFSNVQFRTAQMAEFYSIINASYQAKEARSKSTLQHYMLLISLLSVVLALLFAYLYKQLRKLSRTKEELSQANLRLTQLNDELNDKNAQLSDSNDLKEQYIARFFDLCSLYIDKMDSYRKTLNRLAQNRQFDELFKRLKSTSMMENELDELYKNFDAIFLNLYPTFVADFNSLLIPEERIALRPGDLLNKELRIYALLRMGITASAKIASFLRCSLSTVYNYRTKMRNKAALSREKFEKMVSEIGNTPVKEPQ